MICDVLTPALSLGYISDTGVKAPDSTNSWLYRASGDDVNYVEMAFVHYHKLRSFSTMMCTESGCL